ncbi:MAG: hypothetical protein LC731_03145 [Acidobacteria bacterium]|nr:hypothetical protein [Acidobacteriota bacterium]
MEAAPRVVPVQVRSTGAPFSSALKFSHTFFGPYAAYGLFDSTLQGEAMCLASAVGRVRLAQFLSLQDGARPRNTFQTAQSSQKLEAFVDETLLMTAARGHI